MALVLSGWSSPTMFSLLLVSLLVITVTARGTNSDRLEMAQVGTGAFTDAELKPKVLIIGIDGCRADVFDKYRQSSDSLGLFNTLMGEKETVSKDEEQDDQEEDGISIEGRGTVCVQNKDASCAHAQDGPTSHTYASHWCTAIGWGSVVTGLQNYHHHVMGNEDVQQFPFVETTKKFPSMFVLAKRHSFTTGACGACNFLSYKESGDMGVVDYECGADPKTFLPYTRYKDASSCNLDRRQAQDGHDEERDNKSTEFTLKNIRDGIDVNFEHFDLVDHNGHRHGFSYNEHYVGQLKKTEENVQRLIQGVRDSIKASGGTERWLVMVTSDHGGHQFSHDKDVINDRAVPFTVAQILPKKVAREVMAMNKMMDGNAMEELSYPVYHFDVHPTVMAWLGIEDPAKRDGKVQGISSRFRNTRS
eukprot:Nk52_evm17s270 gene=Nk52_evmTU17s270